MSERPFAISPRFFSDFRDIDDYVSEFGFSKWKFNSDLDDGKSRRWLQAFELWVQELSPIDQSRVRSYLSRRLIQQTLIPSLAANNSEKANWHQVVSELNTDSFETIVGDWMDPAPYQSWIQALPDIRASRRDTLHYCASEDGICNLLRPLLKDSPALILLDPWFFPCKKNELRLLENLLREMIGSRCYELHIITRDIYRAVKKSYRSAIEGNESYPRNYEEFDASLCAHIQAYIGRDRRLQVHLVDDSSRRDKLVLHKRMAVGSDGSLRFDKGFTITNQLEEAYTVERKNHIEDKAFLHTHVIRFGETSGAASHKKRPKTVTTFTFLGN